VQGGYQWIWQESKQPGRQKLQEPLMGRKLRWVWMEKVNEYDRIGNDSTR
jgi:hypothetical protein